MRPNPILLAGVDFSGRTMRYQRVKNELSLVAVRRSFKNPHELYDKMRSHDRIYFDSSSQSWLVTGHDAVTAILDDPRFISGLTSVKSSTSRQMPSVSKQMLFLDGQAHRRAQDVMLRPLAFMVKHMPEH